MERDADDLDRRIRGAAAREAQRFEHDVDVEGDLDSVRNRRDDAPDLVAARPATRWLLIAACAVLVVAGGVAVASWRGGDGGSVTGDTIAPAPSVASTTSAPAITSAPVATALATVAPTSVPVASTAPSADDCTGAVFAPPSLADGSTTPNEVAFEDGGTRAVWGDDPMVRVTQAVDEPPTDDTFGEGGFSDRGYEYAVLSVGDGTPSIVVRGPDGFCPRRYDLTLPFFDALELARRWVDSYATGEPVRGGDHPELPLPTGYVGLTYGSESVPGYVRLSPTGVNMGRLPDLDIEIATAGLGRLADGRLVRFSPEAQRTFVPCENTPIELVVDGAAQPVHADLPAVRSMAVSPSGVVVATRAVCVDGAPLDDPANTEQLVRVDLAAPGAAVEVLRTDPLDLRDGANWVANPSVVSMSADARHVGMVEPYHTEKSRYRILDLDVDASAPMELASGCDTAADIIAVPAFVDGSVVVTRWCPDPDAADPLGETGDVVVDQVSLADGTVAWTGRVTVAELHPSYGNVVGVSVFVDPADGSAWVIVNGSDVETPTTSILLHGDVEVDITHLGMTWLGFRIDDLLGL